MTVSVLKAGGLYTSPNKLSAVPEGAWTTADNVVVNYDGVVESRRGYEYVDHTFGLSPADNARQLFFYDDTLLVLYGTALAYDSGTSFVDYSGEYTPPSSTQRPRSVLANQNLYFTTDTGIKGLDSVTSTPFDAGIPKATPLVSTTADSHTYGQPNEGWLETDKQVGYVLVYGKKDEKKNVKLGEPSGRVLVGNPADSTAPTGGVSRDADGHTVTVTVSDDAGHGLGAGDVCYITFNAGDSALFTSGNFTVTSVTTANIFVVDNVGTPGNTAHDATVSSGTKDVKLWFDLPAFLDDTYFYRIYRTFASATVTTDPGAEYYLVYEGTLSSTDFSTGYVTYVDDIADSFLSDPLYTNIRTGEATDDPNDKANGRPPWCTDIATWRERVWFGNTKSKHRLILNLLGVGSSDTVTEGVQISIYNDDGFTEFICSNVTSGDGYFRYATTGSASQQIERTAQYFCNSVNKSVDSPVNAYYISGPDDPPGKILLEERAVGGGEFWVVGTPTANNSAWSPVLGADSADKNALSDNNALPHGLYFSKYDEPEAVPYFNYTTVGSKSRDILRTVPLRDRLYVFKEDGIFTVSGEYPFRVDLLDNTAILLAPDSVVTLNNKIFALTTQGVVEVSDAGVGIISAPIEGDIKSLFGVVLPLVQQYAFAVGYESYRKLFLWLPSGASSTSADQCYVYDVSTNVWTRHTKEAGCGGVNPGTDYFYIGAVGINKISKERKTYSRDDYYDEDFTVTLTAATGTLVTLSDVTNINIGDMLWQSTTCNAVVTDIDYDNSTVTLNATQNWTHPQVTSVYPSIDCEVTWSPQFAGAPSQSKHFRECTIHFDTPSISTATATYSTDLNPTNSTQSIDVPGWGDQPWGSFAWGLPGGPKNKRMVIPTTAQRGSYLKIRVNVREARSQWSINGYSLELDITGERNSR